MREIITSVRYKKELKKAVKSKTFDINVLNDVIEKLAMDIPLDAKYDNHPLKGN